MYDASAVAVWLGGYFLILFLILGCCGFTCLVVVLESEFAIAPFELNVEVKIRFVGRALKE